MYAKDGIKAKGFTLIELLIVVIIVAIMAAIVVPQFTDSSTEAKEAALDANLAAMRSAVELYKVQHKGKYPGANSSKSTCTAGGGTITLSDTSTAADRAQAFIEQLTMATDENGSACKVADATFKHGPYLKSKVPSDPFHNKGSKNTEIVVTTDGSIPDPAADTGGWKFDTAIGKLIMNSNATDSRGNFYYQH